MDKYDEKALRKQRDRILELLEMHEERLLEAPNDFPNETEESLKESDFYKYHEEYVLKYRQELEEFDNSLSEEAKKSLGIV